MKLKQSFYSSTERNEVFLNLVLEFVPDTVYRIIKHYSKRNQRMPHIYVKLYMFQMFCALAHIHSMGVCHRDIKPQNLLVDTSTHTLKLCDFGSAKILVRGERNISYICSRYYRCCARPRCAPCAPCTNQTGAHLAVVAESIAMPRPGQFLC